MSEQVTKTQENGTILHNLVLFGRLLRALGMDINPGRMLDLVQALDHVPLGAKSDFYFTARSLFVHRREDIPLFDEAFELFWKKPSDGEVEFSLFNHMGEAPPQEVFVPPQPEQMIPADSEEERSESEEEDEETQQIIEVTQTYSTRERISQIDFGQMSADELQLVKKFMSELVWNIGQRRTRRKRAAIHGRILDLRRTLRHNMRYGGELLEWPRRQIKIKPRPVIIIADISGSMEQYTKLLLHFVYGLAGSLDQKVEAFVFSTRLTRITRQLQHKDLDKALADVSGEVTDWSGGTRIGESIKSFNFDWGRRVLGRGAVVLLISDGWDRGEPELLRDEMARLQRNVHRLIWLNPLLGSERYEPLTRGMQAALPHIDDFLPVHNLQSLEELADHLAGLTAVNKQARRRKPNLKGAAFIRKI
ncbi:MAG: VWA domain-containing protein [Chloroflexota bacterium]